LPPACCAALAFAVYANSLGNGFITDDQFQILNNPVVTGARPLFSAFTTGVWAFLGHTGNYYRPLQFVVYGAIYRAFGPNAVPFHLWMALLHAVNTVLVFGLARRLFGDKPGAAWIAGAVFAAHPIHTEAVDWIAALPDLLVTTLVLCGLRARRTAPLLYLAALLTKETGVVLPALYAAQDWLRGTRPNRAVYAGMAAALAVYLGLRVNALGGLAPAQQTFFHLPPAEFVLSALVLAGRYLLALVFPVGLNFFHVFHPETAVWPWPVLAAAGLAAAAVAARRSRLAIFAVFWMAAALAPALNLTGVGQNVFAERYLYLPSVGFVLLAGIVPSWRRAWPLAALVVLVFSAASVARNRDWQDDFTLLQVTARQSPDSAYIHNLLAGAWVQRGQFQRARDEQTLAVRYEPRSPVYRKNLGNILLALQPAAAIPEFQAVVALEPGSAEAHSNLGLAYMATGRMAEAAAEFRAALAIDPRSAEAAAGLARTEAR
jgi:hypothetical protein